MKLYLSVSPRKEAQEYAETLKKHFSIVEAQDADYILAVGGDGRLLHTLQETIDIDKPVFGVGLGHVCFLMNKNYGIDTLAQTLENAEVKNVYPLSMEATMQDGQKHTAFAFNEVSLRREKSQLAHIKISVDDKVRMESLEGDGVMVATPFGSTAYNLSAHGPIIPLGQSILALTPICAFRPRRWQGALLPHTATIRFDIHEPEFRPVVASADNLEFPSVSSVLVQQSDICKRVLFDSAHSWDERILREQFAPS
ncbi:MAG: NAD kinase [Alphaproteobacteria bacterium]|nr:NAD kinase [Alphaproteobacteria bacterium]